MMKITYTIKRSDLKHKRYKSGARSTKGAGPAAYDDKLLNMILKIIQK